MVHHEQSFFSAHNEWFDLQEAVLRWIDQLNIQLPLQQSLRQATPDHTTLQSRGLIGEMER